MSNAWLSRYVPPSKSLWQGRADTLPGERLFQLVTCHDLRNPLPLGQNAASFAFIGFCSDEGIRRNLGRVGAVQGPQALRHALGRLAVHLGDKIDILDVGDITCEEGDLEASQLALKAVVALLISQGFKPIVLGGGHETAYGHYLGIRAAKPSAHIGIINFDAHFDLRALPASGLGTSGTPFYQIATFCKSEEVNFDYYCLGIQRMSNTDSLFQTAEALAVNYVFASDMRQQPITHFFQDLDEFIQGQEHIYLSFCLDVLAQSIAPGVSAPQPLGLYAEQVIPLLQRIVASQKVISFDVVELSPAFDRDNMTAHLAAALIWIYLHAA